MGVESEGGTLGHYERLAARFDANWSHSERFLNWMAGRIVATASITAGDRIADVGCGTGLFARRILDLVHPGSGIACVDSSPAMLAQLPAVAGLRPVCASAEDLAAGAAAGAAAGDGIVPGGLDVLVMKEVVHHLAAAQRAATLAGLAGLLASGGRIVVVMLPSSVQYPLFAAALERFEELQPDPADIESQLRAAGLSTAVTYEAFGLEFPKDRYLSMVRERYMSLLSTFDDAQIAAGVEEIDRRHPDPVLHFEDRFAFILATRDKNPP